MWSNLVVIARCFACILSVDSLFLGGLFIQTALAASPQLPTVDLGYAIYQATDFNKRNGYINFLNIRYAAPPVGPRRWAPPEPPLDERSAGPIDSSSLKQSCPQSAQNWVPRTLQSLGDDAKHTIPSGVPSSQESEDCLFLDVSTPQKAFEGATGGRRRLSPVLVYIHGGGFVLGAKTLAYASSGLFTQGENDMVFVSMQYRLGVFGWLTDPSSRSSITPNLGLLDQRQALEWVQEHIHLFGGDPRRVTLMGESAGGGSVLYQSTAYGGEGPQLFQQAIPQSPYVINITEIQQQRSLETFLGLLNVRSIEEAKELPTKAIQAVNRQMVENARFGTYIWGPVIDGTFVPDLPGRLMRRGQYNRRLVMMPGRVSDEGRIFTDQTAFTEEDFYEYLVATYPGAPKEALAFVGQSLYPPVYDGSFPYRTPQQRLGLLVGESLFDCHCLAAYQAYRDRAFGYVLAVPPGLHFQDVMYLFDEIGPVEHPQIATAFQRYHAQFARTGNPNSPGLPYFPRFSEGGVTLWLSDKGITPREEKDGGGYRRCAFWLDGAIFTFRGNAESRRLPGPREGQRSSQRPGQKPAQELTRRPNLRSSEGLSSSPGDARRSSNRAVPRPE